MDPAASESADVSEYIRGPDPELAPEDIHVRPRFCALVDLLFADVCGVSRAPILSGRSFSWMALRLTTMIPLSLVHI